jgi:hypothetical protein
MQSTTNTINAPNTNAKYINTGWVGRPGLLLWQGWLSLALSRLKDCRAHSQPCALHAYTARLDILSKKTYTHIYVYVVYTYMYTYISYTSTLPHWRRRATWATLEQNWHHEFHHPSHIDQQASQYHQPSGHARPGAPTPRQYAHCILLKTEAHACMDFHRWRFAAYHSLGYILLLDQESGARQSFSRVALQKLHTHFFMPHYIRRLPRVALSLFSALLCWHWSLMPVMRDSNPTGKRMDLNGLTGNTNHIMWTILSWYWYTTCCRHRL